MMQRLLVVEDQVGTALWLAALLGKAFPRVEVVIANDLARACVLLAQDGWSLALVDLGLPDGSGLDLIGKIRQRCPATPVVVVTVHDDDEHLFAALAAGAEGYLLKEQSDDMLVMQLRLWAEGQPPLSPRMATRILSHFREVPTRNSTKEFVTLTPRETDVLACIGRGLRVHEAAQHLGIAESTVTSYVKSIYEKLNINSRAEAALEATRRGLVRP